MSSDKNASGKKKKETSKRKAAGARRSRRSKLAKQMKQARERVGVVEVEDAGGRAQEDELRGGGAFDHLVVHCMKAEYDVYVGRANPKVPCDDLSFGNPFPLRQCVDRVDCVAKFKAWVEAPEQAELLARVKAELRGKVLACWCSPKLCHAHVLAGLANGEE